MSSWLVTGAGSGLGLALTRALLRRGHAVAATSRDTAALEAEPDSDRLHIFELDVADPDRIREVVDRAADALDGGGGGLDVVASCAGYGALGAAEEHSDAFVSRQIEVNLLGSIHVARAAIPHVRARRGGRLIQISSSGGQVADAGMSVYNAAKSGIEGFYDSIAIELAPFGIEVTLVEPGGTATSFLRNMAHAEPLSAYQDGVIGGIRTLFAGIGAGGGPGRGPGGEVDGAGRVDPAVLEQAMRVDPAKAAEAIIDSTLTTPAPRRLPLGRSSFDAIAQTLLARLDAMKPLRSIAYAADVTAPAGTSA